MNERKNNSFVVDCYMCHHDIPIGEGVEALFGRPGFKWPEWIHKECPVAGVHSEGGFGRVYGPREKL